jgi:hypothetical protein
MLVIYNNEQKVNLQKNDSVSGYSKLTRIQFTGSDNFYYESVINFG